MALTASPYGLIAVQKQASGYNEGGAARSFFQTVNVATALYAGAIVVLGTNGEVTTPAVSPTAATTTPIMGVIVGFEFVDPVLKYQLFDSYLPANAVNGGYTNIRVIVNDDPQQLYKIQATAAVTRAQIGLNTTITNPQAGSTITKRSTSALTAASLAAATNTLRLVDFVIAQDQSTPGDAFTDCIVRICPTAHAYEKAAGPT